MGKARLPMTCVFTMGVYRTLKGLGKGLIWKLDGFEIIQGWHQGGGGFIRRLLVCFVSSAKLEIGARRVRLVYYQA